MTFPLWDALCRQWEEVPPLPVSLALFLRAHEILE